jgi:hypothetical protein
MTLETARQSAIRGWGNNELEWYTNDAENAGSGREVDYYCP